MTSATLREPASRKRGDEVSIGRPMLKVARFKGTTRDEFLDNRQFGGNAFALMRDARLEPP